MPSALSSTLYAPSSQDLAKQIMREVVLPAIENEVNTGANFATVRQIYYAGILARWYCDTIKDSLMGSAYMDQGKTKGVDLDDKTLKEQIYQRYIEAYKKGVVNFIREESDVKTGEVVPRKYFTGGMTEVARIPERAMARRKDPAAVPPAKGKTYNVDWAGAKSGVDYSAAMKNAAENEDRARTGVIHTVQPQDTWEIIAEQYGVDIRTLALHNHSHINEPIFGNTVEVPIAEPGTDAAMANAADAGVGTFGSTEEFEEFHKLFSGEREYDRDYDGAVDTLFDMWTASFASGADAEQAKQAFLDVYLPFLRQHVPPLAADHLREKLLASPYAALQHMGEWIASREVHKLEIQLKSRDKNERRTAAERLSQLALSGQIKRAPLSRESNIHVHSKNSYSPYYPEEIAYRGWLAGLEVIGIIDHYTTAGIKDLHRTAKLFKIKSTGGLEIQASLDGTEIANEEVNSPGVPNVTYHLIHSLADIDNPVLQQLLKDARYEKMLRNERMLKAVIAKLGDKFGINLRSDFGYADAEKLAEIDEGEGQVANTTDRHLMEALAKELSPELMQKIYDALPAKEQGSLAKSFGKYQKSNDTDDALEFLRGVFLKPGTAFSCYEKPNTTESPSLEKVAAAAEAAGGLSVAPYLGSPKPLDLKDPNKQTNEQKLLLNGKLLRVLKNVGRIVAAALMPHRNSNEERDLVVDEIARPEIDVPAGSGVDINRKDQPLLEEKGRVESPWWFKPGDRRYNPLVGKAFWNGANFFVGNETLGRFGFGFQSGSLAKLISDEKARLKFLAWVGAKDFDGLEALDARLADAVDKELVIRDLISSSLEASAADIVMQARQEENPEGATEAAMTNLQAGKEYLTNADHMNAMFVITPANNAENTALRDSREHATRMLMQLARELFEGAIREDGVRRDLTAFWVVAMPFVDDADVKEQFRRGADMRRQAINLRAAEGKKSRRELLEIRRLEREALKAFSDIVREKKPELFSADAAMTEEQSIDQELSLLERQLPGIRDAQRLREMQARLQLWGSGLKALDQTDTVRLVSERLGRLAGDISVLLARFQEGESAITAEDASRVGGIDIQNIDVARTGTGDAIRFDEAALQELVAKGFGGLTPVFLGMTPLDNPLTAMGVK